MHRQRGAGLADYRLNVLVDRPPKPSVEAVRSALRSLLREEVSAVRELHHGAWSWAFGFEAHDQPLIARFSPVRHHFDKDQEAHAMLGDKLPLPNMHAIAHAFGGFISISDRIEGSFVDALGQSELLATLPSIIESIEALREAPLDGREGFGIWAPGGRAPHRTWQDFLLAVTHDVPMQWRDKTFRLISGRLEALTESCPNDHYLVHGDMVNFNILVRDETVMGALDWGWSRYGDSLYDLARFCYLAQEKGWDTMEVAKAIEALWSQHGLGMTYFGERLLCYQLHIGLVAQVNALIRGDTYTAQRLGRRTLGLALGS